MWLALVFACSSPDDSTAPVAKDRGHDRVKVKGKRKAKPQAANSNNADTGEPEPGVGLWNRARDASPKSEAEEIAALEAIGYMGGDEEATTKVGVTIHDAERAVDGVNFWVSGHGPEAFLMAMDGTVLHSWTIRYSEAFPNGEKYNNKRGSEFWRRAFMYPNGDLLGIYEGHGLVKLDKDSKVLWTWDGRAHHDLQVMDDGTIWVLARKGVTLPHISRRPVLEDYAVQLSADGAVLREISLLKAVENSGAKELMSSRKKRAGDIFHTNSIEVLDGTAEPANAAFAEGNILVSMRSLSAVMVLDPEKAEMVWWKTDDFKRQHDPKILSNGHMLLYDNLGYGGASAVREYELRDFRQLWAYGHTPDTPFFSRFTGAAYRFDNGNTLIAESGYGRVFEVTPTREIVWEFHNPNRAGEKKQFVAIIPDMVRFPADYPTFLER